MSRRHPRRKGTGARFARIPLPVLNHPAAQTLSHAQLRLLVLLAGQFNGHNNGALGITKKQAREHGLSERSHYRGLRELEQRGLIERTYPASRVPPRPTMYGLAWEAIDDTEWSVKSKRPSRTFVDWKPSQKPSRNPHKGRLHVVR